jgi:hypothetical protein
MNSHDEFLEGFGDALGIADPETRQLHYEAWLEDTGMTEVERIDIEGHGYIVGLEAGNYYKKEVLHANA